jgi:hypothetical protein
VPLNHYGALSHCRSQSARANLMKLFPRLVILSARCGKPLFSLHQQHSNQQQPHSGQANRIKRYPLNAEPAERVCQIRADHLPENGRADDSDDTHLGDGDNGTENKTDAKRPSEVSPKRCGLHPPKSGSGASESPGHHYAQENQAAGEEGDRRAQDGGFNGQAQARIERTLDGDKKAGHYHDEDGQQAHTDTKLFLPATEVQSTIPSGMQISSDNGF